jgi:hypothetical protein
LPNDNIKRLRGVRYLACLDPDVDADQMISDHNLVLDDRAGTTVVREQFVVPGKGYVETYFYCDGLAESHVCFKLLLEWFQAQLANPRDATPEMGKTDRKLFANRDLRQI